MSEQTAGLDGFLLELQNDFIASLETRIKEFCAEQSADFPVVDDLGSVGLGLWSELLKDANNCELKLWADYFEECLNTLSNPPFSDIWKTYQPQQKTIFWEKLVNSITDASQKFPSERSVVPLKMTSLIADLETDQAATAPAEKIKNSIPHKIDEDLYLKCNIRGQFFILPVCKVVEIQQARKLTPLPEHQISVTGLISSRGEMFPIFSLHELQEIAPDQENFKYYIICEDMGHKYGFAVDSTDQVVKVDTDKFQPATAMMGFQGTNYIRHSLILDEKIYLVINPEKIAS